MPDKIWDIHGDDLGVSNSSSDDILALCRENLLDSVSLIPNMSAWDYTVSEFKKLSTRPEVSVHLNFMEGHCCSPVAEVPDLVDSGGFFKISWLHLILYNYNPFVRKKIREELTVEILNQTEKCIDAGVVNPAGLRFDSHQHPHMIPIVRDALFAAVDILAKAGKKTVFIRNSRELLRPYLYSCRHRKIYAVNFIKCIILNFYSAGLERRLVKRGINKSFLCGVFFSGMMIMDNLSEVLEIYEKLVLKKKCRAELLFHPGKVKKDEITEEFVKPGFVKFHVSEARSLEYETVRKIKA